MGKWGANHSVEGHLKLSKYQSEYAVKHVQSSTVGTLLKIQS